MINPFDFDNFKDLLLKISGFEKDDIPRFRGIRLIKEDGNILLEIETRTGGNNRADYKYGNAAMRKNQFYEYDFDDDFDSTYAYFVYKINPDFMELAERIYNSQYSSYQEWLKLNLNVFWDAEATK